MSSLLDEAGRLDAFVPPFAFSAFFSPEDTLLCVLAADKARELLTARDDTPNRITELTSGSGLVGFYLLGRDPTARLLGLDVDKEAAKVAEWNALILGFSGRARFAQADLWSRETLKLVEAENPQLIVCNPPYIPEPPGTQMGIEAGSGPHGTAHVLRAIELARKVQPETLALSWCSLADPARIVAAAEEAGYDLDTLYVTAIADGEYSGSVHSYLRALPDCFINEHPETLEIIASDGSARFAFLLLAGTFKRRKNTDALRTGITDPLTTDNPTDQLQASRLTHSKLRSPVDAPVAKAVEKLCADFAESGIPSLAQATAPFHLRCSMLTRWDELALRIMLHGAPHRATPAA